MVYKHNKAFVAALLWLLRGQRLCNVTSSSVRTAVRHYSSTLWLQLHFFPSLPSEGGKDNADVLVSVAPRCEQKLAASPSFVYKLQAEAFSLATVCNSFDACMMFLEAAVSKH